IMPYWEGIAVDEALVYTQQRVDELRHAYPGKPIVISAIGWPSSGPVRQGAIPSAANQAQFVAALATGGLARSHSYFLVEAYDQPGNVALWGLFDLHRTAKPAVEALHQAVLRAE